MRSLLLVPSKKELELLKVNLLEDFNQPLIELGVGPVHPLLQLPKILKQAGKIDFLILVGIAGSFRDSLSIGSVVQVVEDAFGDIGVEGEEGVFVSATDLALIPKGEMQISIQGVDALEKSLESIPKVKALSVSRCSGTEFTIAQRQSQFDPDIEQMEGASVGLFCQAHNIPLLHLRGISNMVERRNPKNWKIDLAIQNLAHTLKSLSFS